MSKPDPWDFPAPNRWATFIPFRSPEFKTHTDLGKAKNAVGGKFIYKSKGVHVASTNMWVYEWVDDDDGKRWVERFEILRGDTKEDHPLWKFRVPKGAKKTAEVSEKQMEKAIASIMEAANND